MLDATQFQVELAEATEHPEVLRRLRAGFVEQDRRSLVLSDLLSPIVAATMRGAVDAKLQSFSIPDRGLYEFVDLTPDAVEPLRKLATRVAGRDLLVYGARALRLGHGSYQLTRDDRCDQEANGVFGLLHLELTLDFSATLTGEGDLVFSDATSAPALTVPQLPGSAFLVERAPLENSLYRFCRYLPFRVGNQHVHRLRVVLR